MSDSWARTWRGRIVPLLAPIGPRVWHAHTGLWHIVYADNIQAANEQQHRKPRKTAT